MSEARQQRPQTTRAELRGAVSLRVRAGEGRNSSAAWNLRWDRNRNGKPKWLVSSKLLQPLSVFHLTDDVMEKRLAVLATVSLSYQPTKGGTLKLTFILCVTSPAGWEGKVTKQPDSVLASVWLVVILSPRWAINTTNTEYYALCNSQRLKFKFSGANNFLKASKILLCGLIINVGLCGFDFTLLLICCIFSLNQSGSKNNGNLH